MKKIFITAAPMQDVSPKPDAPATKYVSVNNKYLKYDKECCYPILPLVNGYANEGDDVIVYVVTTDRNVNKSEANFSEMTSLIEKLCKDKGSKCTVRKIAIPFSETIETHLDTFKELISNIKADSAGEQTLMFADITYQARCLPIIEMMALNFAANSLRNCFVECIVYGSYDWANRKSEDCRKIYDITSLFLMDQIVNEMSKSGNSNPVEVIESILDVNSSMEAEDDDAGE